MDLLRCGTFQNCKTTKNIPVAKIASFPAHESQAVQIDIVNDQYLRQSTKSGTRVIRADGEVSQRVHIKSVDQKMLSGKEWEEFFHNGENKEDLIALACSFYKSEEGRELFRIPLVINSGEEVWKISRNTIEMLPRCNHEEADTRLVLHAAMSKSPAVIVAKDTDVFILLAYAICHQGTPPSWYMKIDTNQFINIAMIYDSLGSEICSMLPQLHAITGCDTTAYKFNTGKVRVLNKVTKDPSCLLLISKLGSDIELTSEVIENAKLFVQTVIYGGKN